MKIAEKSVQAKTRDNLLNGMNEKGPEIGGREWERSGRNSTKTSSKTKITRR